jgi:hypothetical protein
VHALSSAAAADIGARVAARRKMIRGGLRAAVGGVQKCPAKAAAGLEKQAKNRGRCMHVIRRSADQSRQARAAVYQHAMQIRQVENEQPA